MFVLGEIFWPLALSLRLEGPEDGMGVFVVFQCICQLDYFFIVFSFVVAV